MLVGHHLLYSQNRDGSFIEQYNWENRTAVVASLGNHADGEVQAMALWALTTLYREVATAPPSLSSHPCVRICFRAIFAPHARACVVW